MNVKQEICDSSQDDSGRANVDLNQVRYASLEGDDLTQPVSFELKDEQSDMLFELNEDIGNIAQDDKRLEKESLEEYCKPFLHIDIKQECLIHSNSSLESDVLAVPVSFELKDKLSDTLNEVHEDFAGVTQENQIEKERLGDDCKPFLRIDIKEEYLDDDFSMQEQDPLAMSPNLATYNSLHTEDKPFKCLTCSKVFSGKSALTRHCRMHTGDRPYICATCSKPFTEKSDFTRHCTIHTGVKPFKCSTCNKTFSRKSDLIIHCRMHTGEKPFKCTTCSKVYSDKSTLRKHFRIHIGEKPFKCAICGITFRQKSHLAMHCKLHEGVKPFKCATCSKPFSRKSDLVVHCRMHTGEKPFKCAICSKAFSDKSTLRKHYKLHSKLVF